MIKKIKKDYKRKLAKDIKIFLKKKKKKNQQYGHERYKNLSKGEKINKLAEYRKKQNKKKHFIIITRKYFNLKCCL